MLPTADAHFAQIGRELAGDVMKRRQVCNVHMLKPLQYALPLGQTLREHGTG